MNNFAAACHRLLRKIFLTCLLFPFHLHAADDPAQQLQGYLESAQTLQAEFSQTISAGSRAAQQSTGVVYLWRPNRFRWEYRKPFPQLVVGDGRKVWVYDSELRQVTVRQQDMTLGSTPAALLAGGSTISQSFTVRDGGAKDGLQWFEMTPTHDDSSFVWLKLAFSQNVIARMAFKDSFDQVTEIRFSKVKVNGTTDGKLFQFTPPAGVDVLRENE